MNGYGPPRPASVWAETRSADGKVYYFNSATQATTWDKPQELMSDNERALVGTPWKEYKNPEGRPYWHNPESKETTWEMPEIVANKLQALKIDSQAPPPRPAATPNTWAAGPSSFQPAYNPRSHDRDDYQPSERRDREAGYGIADRGPIAFGSSTELLFSNPEEADAAFTKLLKQLRVQADWSWKQTIRAGIRESNWRAIPDPKSREEAFKKYCDELRTQEKAKEQDRRAKLRSDFTAMLRSHPEIKHYTRWKTALPIIEHESIFRSAKDDGERRILFDEYILSLQRFHAEQEVEAKKSALDDLADLLQSLDLEPFTRWHTAEDILQKEERFSAENFQHLNKIDVLNTFERHIRQLQRELNDRVQAERRAKHRIERKNREGYMELLQELKANGQLKIGTKWKEIHRVINEDPRYLAMLGQNGSSPLDLFWDALEEEEGKFRTLRRYALDVLELQRFQVETNTPFEEFLAVMRNDARTANIDEQLMKAIFAYVVGKVKKREDDQRRDSEHHERRAMDDLRSVLKHLDPPVSATDSWEDTRPRVEKSEEFKALKSESSRQSVFEKFIRRLKDKEKDRERSRRDPRDRDRDRRERDREYRNGHTDSHRRHRERTHSPEHDSYAAERKQAQQDREARYRNNDSTGLSPPHRRGRDDDRYERSRRGSGDHYGRERRDREQERERPYVSRADPRERSVSELDYGDNRPVSTGRRRRESDESNAGKRDSKRPRRDRRSKTPAQQPAAEPPKEDPGLRSGSEEGEIEED